MSLDLYFAGAQEGTEQTLLDLGAHRLLSQLNDRSLIHKFIEFKKQGYKFKLFVDSGAYSAHTKGKVINVDEYIEFLNTYTEYFDLFAQVDTIPGKYRQPKTLQELSEAPEHSWENYLYMRERIIDKDKLIPIFHQGDDFKHLRRMLEWTDENGNHIPYIGISAAADVPSRYWDEWLRLCFTTIRESSNPNVKTHAFGITSRRLLNTFPFTSGDGTTWIQKAIVGNIFFGKIENLQVSNRQLHDKMHYYNLPEHLRQEFLDKVEERGFKIEELESIVRERCKWNAIEIMEWLKTHEVKAKNRKVKRLF